MKDALHALMASDRQDWETPPDLFRTLHAQSPRTLDVCAYPHNSKCARYLTPHQDGLAHPWQGEQCWLNPPYGRQIDRWLAKAWQETRTPGTSVLALIPARTDTRWWHRYVMDAARIYLVKGRIRFVGATSSAPFPSAIVLWDLRLGPRQIHPISAPCWDLQLP